MSDYEPRLYLDRENRKWTGLCAGLADSAGVPVAAVRIAAVALTFTAFPPLICAYFLVSFFLPSKKPTQNYVGPGMQAGQMQPGSVARLAIELNDRGEAVLVPQVLVPQQVGNFATTTAPVDPFATAKLKIEALARYDNIMARMNAVETHVMNANIGLSAQIDRLPLQHGKAIISPEPARTIDDLLDMQQVQALAMSGPPRTFGRARPRV